MKAVRLQRMESAHSGTYQAYIETFRLPEAFIAAARKARYTRRFCRNAEIEAIGSEWLRKD